MLVPTKRNLSPQERAQLGNYSATVTYLIRAAKNPDFCGISAESLANDRGNFTAKSASSTRTIYDSHGLTVVRFEFREEGGGAISRRNRKFTGPISGE